MSTYYLIQQTEYRTPKLRIVTAGQLTRHPRSRLYKTKSGRVGVMVMTPTGNWEKDKELPESYKLLGRFPSWEDANEEWQKLSIIEQVHDI